MTRPATHLTTDQIAALLQPHVGAKLPGTSRTTAAVDILHHARSINACIVAVDAQGVTYSFIDTQLIPWAAIRSVEIYSTDPDDRGRVVYSHAGYEPADAPVDAAPVAVDLTDTVVFDLIRHAAMLDKGQRAFRRSGL